MRGGTAHLGVNAYRQPETCPALPPQFPPPLRQKPSMSVIIPSTHPAVFYSAYLVCSHFAGRASF